ncbi:hypothetical protein NKG94_47240 [Micromonospora sp. M12]
MAAGRSRTISSLCCRPAAPGPGRSSSGRSAYQPWSCSTRWSWSPRPARLALRLFHHALLLQLGGVTASTSIVSPGAHIVPPGSVHEADSRTCTSLSLI